MLYSANYQPVRKNRGNEAKDIIMMTGMKKRAMMTIVLVLTIAAAITIYPQQQQDKQPPQEKQSTCDCYFPNTKEYGVKKDGKCIKTKCQVKAPNK